MRCRVLRPRRSERGQAAVELGLASLVIVTVLLFGIHYGEVMAIKLRLQQAGAAALFDTTGVRMHVFRNNLDAADYYSWDRMVDDSGRPPHVRAQELYADLDGVNTGATQLQLSTTVARDVTVNCQGETLAVVTTSFPAVDTSYRASPTGDGMACNASAAVDLAFIPSSFQDNGGGFFKADHVGLNGYQLCAFGRAQGGACLPAVAIALDDWALQGSGAGFGDELNDCGRGCGIGDQNTAGNQAYKWTVRRMYDYYNPDSTNTSDIPNFIREIFMSNPAFPEMADVPVDERTFRLAFMGEDPTPEHDEPFKFRTREPSPDHLDVQDFEWAVTPYYGAYETAYARREQCFLGSSCATSLFE